jgi:archaellum biogenesis ATPase FlaH
MSATVDVEGLRHSVDLVDFISRYVELRKEGSELAGLCPFHADSSPSLKVNPSKQVWACFACAEHEKNGADVFGFLMSYEQIDFPEAIKRLQSGNGSLPDRKPIVRSPLKKSPPRVLVVPPAGSMPDLERRDFGAPSKVWTIRTTTGEPLLYEARYLVNGAKETRVYSFGRYSDTDPPRWECKHPPAPRPWYGQEHLAERPTAQVMIHEAAKKAEAGERLFPALVHLGMLGGVHQVAHMDLALLAGRRCVLLPDNDEPGLQAMRRLAPLLWAAGAKEVKGINPETQPDGSLTPESWDIGDISTGHEIWSPAVALKWAKERTVVYEIDAAQQAQRTELSSQECPGGDPRAESNDTSRPAAAASPETAPGSLGRDSSASPAPAPESTDRPVIVKPAHGRGNGAAGPALTPKQRVKAQETAARAEILAGMVFTCIADVRPEAVRWLWPGRIPLGELTMIVGDPGLGKSQICASLTSVVTNGGQWPVTRERSEVGSVLILSAEDNIKHTIRPRLDAAGADVQRCHTLQAVRRQADDGTTFEGSFNLAEDLAKLSVLMDHLGDVRLVIIDPVSAYLGSTDSHKNAEVRGMLAPLTTLAGHHRAAVILVSHLTKSQSTSALMRVQGSIAFAALCRAVWGVAADKDNHDRRLFMPLKNNLGQDKQGLAYSIESMQLEAQDEGEPIGTSRIMWESEAVEIGAEEAFAGAMDYEERGEIKSAREFLQDLLAEGRVRSSEAQASAKQAGHSITTLGRAKRSLKVTSEREGFGPKAIWYWKLPEDKPQEQPRPPSWLKDD